MVMWTKNGAVTLPQVLKRINQVIPAKHINHKIAIDDSSVDGTVGLLRYYGWKVYCNVKGGISAGANQALSMVEAEYFCSFEQDLLLAKNWWKRVGSRIGKLGASSGIRYSSQPTYITKLQKYAAQKYIEDKGSLGFTIGKTLDNTIFNTEALRKIGGFPKLETAAGVDLLLAYKLFDAGYKWHVDYSCESIHLRTGLMDELQHQRSYGKQLPYIWQRLKKEGHPPATERKEIFMRFVTSLINGAYVSMTIKEPRIFFAYPILRLYYLQGVLQSCYT